MIACRSCHRAIVWVTIAASGKKMPLDPGARPDGNIRMTGNRAADGSRLAEYVKRDAVLPAGASTLRFVSHFASCPHAAAHKTKAPA